MDKFTRDVNSSKINLIDSYLRNFQKVQLSKDSMLAQWGDRYACPIDSIMFDEADVGQDLIWLKDNVSIYKFNLIDLLKTLITIEEIQKTNTPLTFKEMLFLVAKPLETTLNEKTDKHAQWIL
jgi:hypothetical protein